ncbi:MAG TPA: TlpA disulfide reductase family protein [Anaerolineae bacterium]|nr:TlpA disulfide reductase family protein [Anaerolineae bacterium]
MKRKLLSVMMSSIVFVLMVAACSPAAAPTREVAMAKPTEDTLMKPTAEAMMEPTTDAMAKPTEDAMMKPTAEAMMQPTTDAMMEPTHDAMMEPTADAMAKPTEDAMMKPTADAMMSESPAWLATSLTDVNTGQAFKLTDFKGQVVLVEGMAAWCTNCLQQQRELAKLHEKLGDQALSVAIDIDLQEDAALLKKHAETNGFNWRFAVATPELAKTLSDQFGSQFLNPTSVPMFLLDKEGGVHLLDFGQKSVDYLTQQIQMYQ